MTYLLLEGFESDRSLFYRYAGAPWAADFPGRLIGKAESIAGATLYTRIEDIASPLAEGSFGFGVYVESTASDGWGWIGLGILNEVQISIRIRKQGNSVFIQPYRGEPGAGAFIASEVSLGTTDFWNYVQVYSHMIGANGVLQIMKNGDSQNLLMDLNGIDATGLGQDGFNSLHIRTEAFMHLDDIHVWDASGAQKFGTDLALVERELTAVGDIDQFTTVGAADPVTALNSESTEAYITSANTGDQALYQIEDVGALADVVEAVQIDLHARTDQVGFRVMKVLAKEGGTTVDVGVDRILASSRTLGFQRVLNTKPSGGAWTLTAFDGLQIGVENK